MGRLLTIRESAERLGLRDGTVRFWAAKGYLPKVKLGRAVRIPEDALEKLIQGGYIPARRSFRGDIVREMAAAPLVASGRGEP